jgi:hypothetical protein
MAATSSRKNTPDLNKLASLDATEATATVEKSTVEEATNSVAPITPDVVVDSVVAVDSVTNSFAVRPAEHGLPEFPL